nr:glycerol-3-phosphate 1-O-acyltransferase PlsY [Sedimentibacter sp.]
MNYIIAIVISYLMGNLSFAYILGKIIMKKDVRDYGSGNSGATNAIRAFGAKIGVLVFIGDVFKGVAAVLIGKAICGEIGGYLAGVFVIVGHNWPALLNFKGGKGVATTVGVMLTISPFVSLICFAIGLAIAFVTRMVSLGSIIGMSLAPIVILIFIRPFNMQLFIFCLFVVSMSIYRHKENIKRLLTGKENKL